MNNEHIENIAGSLERSQYEKIRQEWHLLSSVGGWVPPTFDPLPQSNAFIQYTEADGVIRVGRFLVKQTHQYSDVVSRHVRVWKIDTLGAEEVVFYNSIQELFKEGRFTHMKDICLWRYLGPDFKPVSVMREG